MVKEIPNFSTLVFVEENNNESLKLNNLVLYQTENGYYKLEKLNNIDLDKKYFKIANANDIFYNYDYYIQKFENVIVSNEINLNDDDIILVNYKSKDNHEFPYNDKKGNYDLVIVKSTFTKTYKLLKYYKNDDKIYLSNVKTNYMLKTRIGNFYKFVKKSNFNEEKYQVVSSIIPEPNND